jgi:hypothetical protein
MSTYRVARDARLSQIARRTRRGGTFPGGLGERVSDVVLRATLYGTATYRRGESDQLPIRLLRNRTVVRAKTVKSNPKPTAAVEIDGDTLAAIASALDIARTVEPAAANEADHATVRAAVGRVKETLAACNGTPAQAFWVERNDVLKAWLKAANVARAEALRRDPVAQLADRERGLAQLLATRATFDGWPTDRLQRTEAALRAVLTLLRDVRAATDYDYSTEQRGVLNAAGLVLQPEEIHAKLAYDIAVTSERVEQARAALRKEQAA